MKKCKKLGWKIGEYEDYIKCKNEYYSFILIKKHEKMINEILTVDQCSIFEDGKYKVTKINYKILLFQDDFPKDILQTISKNSNLLKNIVICDFSNLFEKNVCKILCTTQNIVFSMFEEYLKEIKIALKPLR